jgi:hypothetical protein
MRRMPRGELSRIERLDGRIGWLDRRRRVLAIACAVIITPFVLSPFGDGLGAELPRVHVPVLCAMLGVVVWWAIEVGMVWLIAIWETEHSRLLRDQGLPRAILRRK